jgi:hypothetical protein
LPVKGFARALEDNPAPSSLGDVRLRYAPSMLVGETPPGRRTWRPLVLALLGMTLVASAIASLAAARALESTLGLGLGAAAALWASSWRERLERRHRAFVVNFATTSLRLDFSSPIAGRPRTLVVPFDAVTAVEALEQADGAWCLTVDFTHRGDALREVLVAHVPAVDAAALRRLSRVLEGAFGLGSPPTGRVADGTLGDGRPVDAGVTPSSAGPSGDLARKPE